MWRRIGVAVGLLTGCCVPEGAAGGESEAYRVAVEGDLSHDEAVRVLEATHLDPSGRFCEADCVRAGLETETPDGRRAACSYAHEKTVNYWTYRVLWSPGHSVDGVGQIVLSQKDHRAWQAPDRATWMARCEALDPAATRCVVARSGMIVGKYSNYMGLDHVVDSSSARLDLYACLDEHPAAKAMMQELVVKPAACERWAHFADENLAVEQVQTGGIMRDAARSDLRLVLIDRAETHLWADEAGWKAVQEGVWQCAEQLTDPALTCMQTEWPWGPCRRLAAPATSRLASTPWARAVDRALGEIRAQQPLSQDEISALMHPRPPAREIGSWQAPTDSGRRPELVPSPWGQRAHERSTLE